MSDAKHPSAESRKKNDRVYVLIDRGHRDQLKIISAARNMQLVELLTAMAEREIRSWEKMSGISVEDLLRTGRRRSAQLDETPPKAKDRGGRKGK